MLTVALTKSLRAIKHRNSVWILLAAALLLLAATGVLLVAVPQVGQAQDTAPTAPARLTATPGDTQATLTWDDPGDSSITGYEYLLQAQVAKLTSSEWGSGDEFGYAVAVDENTIVVGAHKADNGKGAAYVLTKESGAWSQVAKLTASDGAADDEFGISVAVDGDTVVVGAHKDDASNTVTNSGSAYVFTEPSGGWGDWDDLPQTHEEDEDKDALTAKLTASDGARIDQFGYSVALHEDTVVVGAHKDDASNTVTNSGSAYVFTKPVTGWVTSTQTVKLTAPDGASGDQLGISVAVDGDTVVVGANKNDASSTFRDSGSAYVFTKPATGWADATQTAKLTASDGARVDEFGYSVAVDGDTVVVGAPYDDFNGGNSGSAYVNEVSDWTAIPDSAHNSDPVGTNAISYTVSGLANGIPYSFKLRAVNDVGASAASDTVTSPPAKPGDLTATVKSTQVTLGWNDPSDTSITGYEYLQAQIAKLTASDGVAGDLFGHSVAVDGDTAVVGAYEDESEKGAAYVLAKDSSGAWSQVAKLTASDGDASSDGEAGDIFGWSVAVDGDTVVVGARYNDSAYVFTKPDDGWNDEEYDGTETAKLTASDGAVGDFFGQSVAVDGDTVVVGASEDDGSGSAYVFTKPSGGWDDDEYDGNETAKLTASDGDDFDEFGKSVAVDGDTVVAGAPNNDGYGSAYVFSKPDDGWDDDEYNGNETAKLTPDPETAGGAAGLAGTFGAAVAVDGDTVVVGASSYAGSQGRAYVFTKPSGAWGTTSEAAELATSDAERNQFGWSVAVDGNTVVVGAHRDDASDSVTGSGSAYVFTKATDSVWADATETVKLTATDGASGDQFGWSIAAGGGTVVVGAHKDDDKGADSGSAYIYGVSGWTAMPDSAAGATNATSYTVNDLINDEDYGFWIRARNTVGASETSEPVTATPVNTAPTAVDDAATMYEDKVVTIVVTANDSDIDPVDTLSVTALTIPDNGGAEINSNSTTTVTYTPNANFNGTDSFDYTLSDRTDTATGTVTITVTAVNDAPTAVDDTTTTAEDTAVDINVVANDTDPDTGDTLSVTAVTTPSNGGAAIDMNNTTVVTYIPNSGYTGTDSFKYTLSDGADTATGTVDITVAAAQAQPAKPTGLTAIAGLGQVTLNWTDPFDGSIDKYEYAQSVSASNLTWSDIPDSANGGTNASSFTVTGLTNGTTYYFWIRATNTPANPATSDASDRVTATPGNAAPIFEDGSTTSRSVEENSEQGANVGVPVEATDQGDTLTYSLSRNGTDADSFSIDANGQITVASGANLDYEDKSSYSITVSVHDGKDVDGADDTTTIDDTIAVTIELSDVAEVPAKTGGFTANAGNAQVTLQWDNPSDSSITERQYLSEQQVAKLTAGDGEASDYFGYSVAVDGDTAVVGAYGDDSSKGAAYVLVRQSGEWSQVAKLTASDGQGSDQFGRSVSVDGDTVVVGAHKDDASDTVTNSGSAYVFTKPDDGWNDDEYDGTETAKLTASDGAANDEFGFSVAVDGDTVVVGAHKDDDKGAESGSVYVFTKPNTGWADASETVKLTASDGVADDNFGFSVTVDGDTMAVGAPQNDDSGSAYVFTRQTGVWSQVAKLTASDRADDNFGISVAVFEEDEEEGEDTVVVGAYWDDDNGGEPGSVYVFTNATNSVWDDARETAKLTASDGAVDDNFGRSVAVNGNTAVVGATQDDDKGSNSGSAYLFTKPVTGWATATETAKLTASDGAPSDTFGISVAMADDTDGYTVVVGAHQDDDKGDDSGSTYVFAVSDWTAIPNSEAGGTNATSFTVTNLTNEAEYDFQIRAVNIHGESDASDAAPVVPVAPEPTPRPRRPTPNAAPMVVDDARTIAAGMAVDIDVVANDTDVEGDTLQVVSVSKPSNGTAVIKSGSATTVTYTPNAGFHGADSFNYTLSDGFNTVTGTVTVTVAPSNAAPMVVDDARTIAAGMAVDIDVVANDTDAEGDTLQVVSVSKPSNGTAVIKSGSATTVTYTPNAGFHGADSFNYTLSDGFNTVTGTVTVTVAPSNAAPMVVDDARTIAAGMAVDIDVVVNDTDAEGDTLQVVSVSKPSNGTAVIKSGSATTVTYTPNAGFHGADSFIYTLSDGFNTVTGTVTVTVAPPNAAPIAVDDAGMIAAGRAVDIDVVANDTDAEGDTLRVVSVTQPSNGTAVIKSGSATTVTYIPNAGFHGTDSFNYILSDGFNTVTGTVTVTVAPPNAAPIAVDDAGMIAAGRAVDIDVVANDTDADEDTLRVALVTMPSNGTAVIKSGSATTVTYTPNAGFHGADSFNYTLSDGFNTVTGIVTVTVAPPNTAPMVVDDAGTIAAGRAVDIDVVANDTDADEDMLRVVLVTMPSNGTAVIKSGSATTVTYTPNAGFHGADSFNYTLSDGFNTVTGTVTVSVAPPNRAPEVVRSMAAVDLTAEGEAVSVDVSGGFTDEDSDLLTYNAASWDAAVVTLEVIGSMLIITPVAAGSTTIEITASDPQGEWATHSVPVTVKAVPDPKPVMPTTAALPTPAQTPVPTPATPTVAPTPTDTSTPPPATLSTLTTGSETMAPPQTADAGRGFPLWRIAAIAVGVLVLGGLGIGAWRLLRA